jgi:hypothetical protein
MQVSLHNLYGLEYGRDQHPNKPGMDGIAHHYRKLLADGWQLVRCENNIATFERGKR